MRKFMILSLFCLSLVSCDYNYHYRVSDEMKRFADFHVGSYWIYYNDSLSVSDTVRVVYHSRTEEYDFVDGDEYYRELIKIAYKSSYDSILKHNNSYIIDQLEAENHYFRNVGIADTMSREVNLFYYSGSFAITSYLFDYKMNGVNYDTIYYYKNSNPYTYGKTVNQRSVEYYFSPDHGAIRKVYQENSSRMDWYLVDYHIVR